ncbi:hydroxysqualene dehydroxylase HpnE [Kozakia baliensis]|uniref:hydroxysqualene dehydroxylase HpnE n=1 Tax=Kozakia baliensis TaxID=153496 RepID=UPI00345BE159
MTHIHIIGGGLAGLSAAVELTGRARVTVYEAGPACGGRARSYFDKALGARIDNGNHLLLSANEGVFRYLGLIGAHDSLVGPGAPVFPWFDLRANLAWTLRLSKGKVPFWALPGGARVPGMKFSELRSLFNLLRANDETRVSDCLVPGMLSERLLEPFAVSALNTSCEEGSAKLLANVVRQSLALGGKACCPWYPREGLSESFVDPAVAHIRTMRGEVRNGARVSALEVGPVGRVAGLHLGDERIALGPEDAVILAVPAPVAQSLAAPHIVGFTAPDQFESIVNVHFCLPQTLQARGVVGDTGFVGVVGGITEWVFIKDRILSVTVSAANRYNEISNDYLIETIWREVCQVVGPVLMTALPEQAPPVRLVREKRATFAATPEQDRLRPEAATPLSNLALAGDWVQTGLPSTIEGAIRSGVQATRALGLVV